MPRYDTHVISHMLRDHDFNNDRVSTNYVTVLCVNLVWLNDNYQRKCKIQISKPKLVSVTNTNCHRFSIKIVSKTNFNHSKVASNLSESVKEHDFSRGG